MSAYGLYKAKVVAPFSSGTCQVVIPQLFGDVRVTISRFSSGDLPLDLRTGWVAFEGGSENYPVWVSAETPVTNSALAGSGLYEITVVSFNAGTGHITGTNSSIHGGAAQDIAPSLFRPSDVPLICEVSPGDTVLAFYPAGESGLNWLPRIIDPAQTDFYDGRYALSAGPGTFRYEHIQGVASNTWTINHGLGGHPGGVMTVNYSGEIIEGDIAYPTNNQIVITFSVPVDGTAYLS